MKLIIGAGGHAKVVYDTMLSDGVSAGEIQIRDDGHASESGITFFGQKVQNPEVPDQAKEHEFHIAIGQNRVRRKLYAELEKAGSAPFSVISSRAIVSQSSEVLSGSFIAPNAIVSAYAHVGYGVIINHGSIVDHDCRIGDFCHIAPGAVLGGSVEIGTSTLIGSNATILPGIKVGKEAVVGAGSVVTRNIQDGQKWIGNRAV